MRLWYLSHRRPAKAQAHVKYGSRRRVRQKKNKKKTNKKQIKHKQKQTSSLTGWLRMRVWRMNLRRTKRAIISWAGLNHPWVWTKSVCIFETLSQHCATVKMFCFNNKSVPHDCLLTFQAFKISYFPGFISTKTEITHLMFVASHVPSFGQKIKMDCPVIPSMHRATMYFHPCSLEHGNFFLDTFYFCWVYIGVKCMCGGLIMSHRTL